MTVEEMFKAIATIIERPYEQVIQTPYVMLLLELTEMYIEDTEKLYKIIGGCKC